MKYDINQNVKYLTEKLIAAKKELIKTYNKKLIVWIEQNEFELENPLMNSKYVDASELKNHLGVLE